MSKENKQDIVLSGKSVIDHDVDARSFNASGKTEILGKLEIQKDVKVSGKNVFNDVVCEKYFGSGKSDISNVLKASKSVKLTGGFHIKEIITKICNIEFSSQSEVESIKADDVMIKRALLDNKMEDSFGNDFKFKFEFFGFSFGVDTNNEDFRKLAKGKKNERLYVGKMNVKNVECQYADADLIEANNVKIGVECHIKKVIYSGKYECHPSSKVDCVVKK